MKFKKHDYLNYSLIDLSEKKGIAIRNGGKFFAYNPLSINESYSHHIIFVHGYNNDFFDALETTYEYFVIFSSFRKDNENYIGIYWPGDTALHFSRAVRQANKASLNMANMINHIIKNSKNPDSTISIIAHSLGNRISAQAILKLKSIHKISPVQNFIQLAPAVDANCYHKEFKQVPKLVDNIVVYHSKKDTTLNHVYDTWNMVRRFRFGRRHEALGTYGPHPHKVPKNINCLEAQRVAGSKVEHSAYLKNERLIKSVAKNIK